MTIFTAVQIYFWFILCAAVAFSLYSETLYRKKKMGTGKPIPFHKQFRSLFFLPFTFSIALLLVLFVILGTATKPSDVPEIFRRVFDS